MKPLIPRPAVTIIAFMITTGMLVNIWLDADPSRDYSGAPNTYMLGALVAGILGIEWVRNWRGGGQ